MGYDVFLRSPVQHGHASLDIPGTLDSLGVGTITGSWAGSPTFSGSVSFTGTPVFNNGANLGTGTFSGDVTFSGGPTVTGSITGYTGGEIRLGGTGAGLTNTISTVSTGSPDMGFHHRGTTNTGTFSFKVGTGATTDVFAILANGRLNIFAPTTTTAPGAGGAGALPATPAGYFTVKIGAFDRQVAYY